MAHHQRCFTTLSVLARDSGRDVANHPERYGLMKDQVRIWELVEATVSKHAAEYTQEDLLKIAKRLHPDLFKQSGSSWFLGEEQSET